jgi:hypothetical protein
MRQSFFDTLYGGVALYPQELAGGASVNCVTLDTRDHEYMEIAVIIGADGQGVTADLMEDAAANGLTATHVTKGGVNVVSTITVANDKLVVFTVKKEALTKRYLLVTLTNGAGAVAANVCVVSIADAHKTPVHNAGVDEHITV